jgi:uncharacterized membrane protein YhaH (DUF805 family)
MSILSLLFSFKGRIKRSQYWLGATLQTVLVIIISVGYIAILGSTFSAEKVKSLNPGSPELRALAPLILPLFAIFGVMLWSGAAIYVKRLHDRNKGAIWLLAIYGPSFATFVFPPAIIFVFVSAIWSFIELGCMAGTPGPNRFDGGDQGAYLDDVFGKAPAKSNKSAPAAEGYGGMEAAMAAVTAAARDNKPAQSNTNFAAQRRSFGQAAPAQFGRLAPSSGGFGRKGL